MVLDWIRKRAPAVNAIMRAVYFKDDPVNLDSGKYENRLTLLKVPRLTKERILRVSPEQYYIRSIDNSIASGRDLIATFKNSEYLYNQLTIRVHRITGSSSYLDVSIKLMTLEEGDIIYRSDMIFYGEERTKTITFNPTSDIYLSIINNHSSEHVLIDYTFNQSEIIYPNTIKLLSKLNANTEITRYFKDSLGLFNRAIIEFSNTGTLDLVITLNTYKKLLTGSKTLYTKTITSGSTFYEAINFDDTYNIKLVLDNNHATLDLNFSIVFFFSKNNDSINMIGESNKAYIPCMFETSHNTTGLYYTLSTGKYTMRTGGSWILFGLPKPTNLGNYKLYITKLKVGISDADASNYLNEIYVYGLNYNSANELFKDLTNKTSPAEVIYPFLSAVDCSPYDVIRIQILSSIVGSDLLDYNSVSLECYYQ